MRWKSVAFATFIAVYAGCSTPVHHQTIVANPVASNDPFAVFSPQPDGREATINYSGLDALLQGIVLRTGPSLRTRAHIPPAITGTKLINGHDSPLRLEGNKVLFSRLDDEVKKVIYALTDELVDVGQRAEFTKLPWDEQLAYWFNLHNMLVISTILKHYPTTSPSRLELGPERTPFHDAPLVEINGVKLSLKDIRLNIVFRHWSDPRVMYGFFHGDLGSPSMRGRAWTGSDIDRALDSNAHEFVNALRGVSKRDGIIAVSALYDEARPTLFRSWPDDLHTHLREFAERPVALILDTLDTFTLSRYEHRTADMVGGRQFMPFNRISSTKIGSRGMGNSGHYDRRIPISSPVFAYMAREVERKLEQLRRNRQRRVVLGGRVIITDLPSVDENEAQERLREQPTSLPLDQSPS